MPITSDINHHSVKLLYDTSPGLSTPDFDIPVPIGWDMKHRCIKCHGSLMVEHWRSFTYRKCLNCGKEQ